MLMEPGSVEAHGSSSGSAFLDRFFDYAVDEKELTTEGKVKSRKTTASAPIAAAYRSNRR